jgi:hypothetical protein
MSQRLCRQPEALPSPTASPKPQSIQVSPPLLSTLPPRLPISVPLPFTGSPLYSGHPMSAVPPSPPNDLLSTNVETIAIYRLPNPGCCSQLAESYRLLRVVSQVEAIPGPAAASSCQMCAPASSSTHTAAAFCSSGA